MSEAIFRIDGKEECIGALLFFQRITARRALFEVLLKDGAIGIAQFTVYVGLQGRFYSSARNQFFPPSFASPEATKLSLNFRTANCRMPRTSSFDSPVNSLISS